MNPLFTMFDPKKVFTYLLMTNDLQNSRNPEEIIQDDSKTRNAESDPRPRTLKLLLRDLKRKQPCLPFKFVILLLSITQFL